MRKILIRFEQEKFIFIGEPYYISDNGIIFDKNDQIVNTYKDSRGYECVKLPIYDPYDDDNDGICGVCRNTKTKIFRVHRLVAINYIPNSIYSRMNLKRNKVFILDRDKSNLNYKNLLWCSQSEINALCAFNNEGLEACMDYAVTHGLGEEQIKHILFDSGYIKKRLFKNKYAKNLIKEAEERSFGKNE